MNTAKRIMIVGVVLGLVGVTLALRAHSNKTEPVGPSQVVEPASPDVLDPPAFAVVKTLPRLVDLGANKCRNCKMMVPVLEGLRTDYAGQLQVDFIDVWKTPSAGEEYGIRIIPTQIFYDSAGMELFRHEGFLSRDDILKKWKAFGVELSVEPAS